MASHRKNLALLSSLGLLLSSLSLPAEAGKTLSRQQNDELANAPLWPPKDPTQLAEYKKILRHVYNYEESLEPLTQEQGVSNEAQHAAAVRAAGVLAQYDSDGSVLAKKGEEVKGKIFNQMRALAEQKGHTPHAARKWILDPDQLAAFNFFYEAGKKSEGWEGDGWRARKSDPPNLPASPRSLR